MSNLQKKSVEIISICIYLPRADSWLKSKWELWEVDKSLFASVRCVVGQGLDEEVGGETGGVQAGLHLAHAVQGDKRVKVAVDAN